MGRLAGGAAGRRRLRQAAPPANSEATRGAVGEVQVWGSPATETQIVALARADLDAAGANTKNNRHKIL
eukprot:1183669-Prorocentrum_minimum.AAC.2